MRFAGSLPLETNSVGGFCASRIDNSCGRANAQLHHVLLSPGGVTVGEFLAPVSDAAAAAELRTQRVRACVWGVSEAACAEEKQMEEHCEIRGAENVEYGLVE